MLKRRFFLFAGFLFVAALVVSIPGSGMGASGFLNDIDPNLRAAASSAVSTAWANSEGTASQVSSSTLFSVFDDGTPEARATGFRAQVTRMVSTGDPAIGAPVGSAAQAYADGAAQTSASPELRYARASAVVFQIRDGFAIVPGGPSQAFNRIQSCLSGAIATNQGNNVQGVSLNCGGAPTRLAVANTIATGFYVQFGRLVGFDCDAMAAQATGGATREARWAAANAWLRANCGAAADAAKSGGSAEMRAAAVAPLAQELASSGASASSLLAAAKGAGSTEWRRANALAAGLVVESTESITISSLGSPTTSTLGNLFSFSLGNALLPTGDAAVAPLARHLSGNDGSLTINVYHNLGAGLLFTSTASTL